jgi:hypothetical protein
MKLAINQPNEIIATPYNNGEEQIKDSIANDQMVISKWALFADQLGFSWCNGTKSPNVGEDFSVIYCKQIIMQTILMLVEKELMRDLELFYQTLK